MPTATAGTQSLTSVKALRCLLQQELTHWWSLYWFFFQHAMIFSPGSLGQVIAYAHSWLWRKKSSPFLQGHGVSHWGGLKGWRLADLPQRPETGWRKGWFLSDGRNSSVHSLSHESSGMTGSRPFPKGPVVILNLPEKLCEPKEGIPASTTIRDFIIIIFDFWEQTSPFLSFWLSQIISLIQVFDFFSCFFFLRYIFILRERERVGTRRIRGTGKL